MSSSSKVMAPVVTSSCPSLSDQTSSTSAACPVLAENPSLQSPIYNVYNQQINSLEAQFKQDEQKAGGAGMFPGLRRPGSDDTNLDPSNNMPMEANQRPAPGQVEALSTSRAKSTIPKGGSDGTWVYPSPQMFFNALVRKNKAEDVHERDMESVISVHNAMNEMTWQTVVNWERLHAQENQATPRLIRFLGRPHDLSPKARFFTMMGGAPPFDRHDWYVDRNGREMRYVIDFYFDETKAGSMDAFSLDTRPALDSFEAALDRVKMNIYQTAYKYGLPCPISGGASSYGPVKN
eukprot:CAMPEP_0196579630 /NCGR_PEP_ID=MMETSP1081-20130531/23778_1 /TAXON_ID=36882 /ORGANISM="Pyramimonas amylifera, Strain CCMP720" /LENGTH=291 /DNA_ID=CAMNT_0041899269 /DNA_START=105 /DNA_END=980 /DNA_ORIENTATION=+